MQVLSMVQWYHFAYMVISVALLGFGAAGTFLTLFRERLLKGSHAVLPALMIATGAVMALVADISQASFVRFDSYLLFAGYSHVGNLLLTYLLFFVPFFLGALAIGLIFIGEVGQIGRIYFANLLGSGAGGVLALVLIWVVSPRQLPALISVLPLLAGLLLLPRKGRIFLGSFALLTAGVIAWKWARPPQLVPSQYKDLSKTLLLPGAAVTSEKSSPYGLLQTVTSPVLRYAPGLSLAAEATAQVKLAAFTNGDWFGAVTPYRRGDTAMVLDYTTMAAPYAMAHRNRVLVLRAATGSEVAHALCRGAGRVVAVEPNAPMMSLLQGPLAQDTDSLFLHPAVKVHQLEPRTFLFMDTAHYDLIVLPVVGTFGGSAGLYALQEQFILTKEALSEMWGRLAPGGVLTVTSWMDYPYRNPLKALATLVEVLNGLGVPNPQQHLLAVRSWGTITFMLTRTPVPPHEVANLRAFCDRLLFDPALLPGLQPGERTTHNQFQDDRFFAYVDKILSPQRTRFYADYDFNIRPATDNRPYFSQYIKWGSLPRVAGFFGNRSLPFFEIGYLLVVVTLVQIAVLSLVLIILPLVRISRKRGATGWVLLYFGGIGLGYMFVELILIQRFILYFGNPVYAASAGITSLLLFSGLGSYTSGALLQRKWRLGAVLGTIVALLLLYSVVLTPVLQHTVHWSLSLKGAVVALLVGPLAFLMGFPFPAGLVRVAQTAEAATPWAWGINGCVSVISTALATIVAVEWGFTWVMLLAAGAYCLPLLVQGRWKGA